MRREGGREGESERKRFGSSYVFSSTWVCPMQIGLSQVLLKTRLISTETLAFQTLLCAQLSTFLAPAFSTHCSVPTPLQVPGEQSPHQTLQNLELYHLHVWFPPPTPSSPSITPKSYPTCKSKLMDQPPSLNFPLSAP